MPSDSNVQAGINSEIHASLRRLEDADYVNNLIRDEETNILIGQANEANSNLQSQIDHLTSEVYQLHSYMEPHIYQGDLCYFQTLYAGNLQVSSGGKIDGTFIFTGEVTFGDSINANGGIDVLNGLGADEITSEGDVYVGASVIVANTDVFDPHTLTVDGVALGGKILATQDMSFSFAGLVSGGWLSNTYTVKTTNNTELASTTVTIEPHISYDSNSHKYQASAYLKVGGTTYYITSASENAWSGTEAYEDGGGGGSQEAHSHYATLEYLATVNNYPTFRRIGGERIGTGTHTVYW